MAYRNTGIIYEETEEGIVKNVKEWYSLKKPDRGIFDKLVSQKVRLAVPIDVQSLSVGSFYEIKENEKEEN